MPEGPSGKLAFDPTVVPFGEWKKAQCSRIYEQHQVIQAVARIGSLEHSKFIKCLRRDLNRVFAGHGFSLARQTKPLQHNSQNIAIVDVSDPEDSKTANDWERYSDQVLQQLTKC